MSTISPSTTETPVKTKRRRAPAPSKTSQGLTALSPDGLYRRDQFIPSIFGIGKTLWHQGVKLRLFPAPAIQGKRLTQWRGADILAAVARFDQSKADELAALIKRGSSTT